MRVDTRSMLAVGASVAFFAGIGPAQAPEFAEPVRLEAGGKFLGEGRLYPSPVYHDLDGDGQLDIVVGDLRGHLTVAYRQRADGRPTFAEEQRIKAVDGKILDFGNW